LLHKKWVSYLYRTAQPLTLATFQFWGSSAGAGRIRLTQCKCNHCNGNKQKDWGRIQNYFEII